MSTTNRNSNLTPLYVIGFPKSGNTWLARLLADVTNSNIAVANDRDVVNAADNSAKRGGRFIIHKVHAIKDPDEVSKDKVVYIVRDVRDVLVSAFFFANGFVNKARVKINNKSSLAMLWRAYYRHQVRRMNKHWCGNELSVLMNWIHGNKNVVGDWSSHLMFWVDRPNVVVVKYEDLLQDPEIELRKILNALNLDVSDEIIRGAVLNQSFAKKKMDFLNVGDEKNANFLRSGKIGDWKNYNAPSLTKEIEGRHAVAMNRFGYQLEFFDK